VCNEEEKDEEDIERGAAKEGMRREESERTASGKDFIPASMMLVKWPLSLKTFATFTAETTSAAEVPEMT